MHRVGSVALAGDDLSRGNFNPLAFLRERGGMLGADYVNQPFMQRFGFAPARLIRLDDCVFAEFKRAIEVAGHKNVAGSQAANSEYVVNFTCRIHEHQSRPAIISHLLDLSEAVRGR
jgi:hypothetical protein